MKVSLLLLTTLDELNAHDFKRFQWSLTQQVLDEYKPILKSYIENTDRQDTVSKMIENYGEESALILAVEILRLMNHNNAADRLTKFAGGSIAAQPTPPTSSSSSFSGSTPAEEAIARALGKSVIVAPNIHGTSHGAAINLNINTK